MYYYYVYITMIVYFLTDVIKWLRGKWNELMKLVIPVWSSIGQDFCVPSMHNREFKFGYQNFLLCQKSFLKVSSKWLLKNKSDNGKLLLGRTYSGERFGAILALLFFLILYITMNHILLVICQLIFSNFVVWTEVLNSQGIFTKSFQGHSLSISPKFSISTLSQTSPGFYVSAALVFWKHCGKKRNCS